MEGKKKEEKEKKMIHLNNFKDFVKAYWLITIAVTIAAIAFLEVIT